MEALHQSCLWCKEKDAGTFLSFLEGECEEVREGLDKLDELRERQTQALEQTSEEQAVASAVVSSSNEALSDLEGEVADVFYCALMMAAALEREYGVDRFSLERAKRQCAAKIRERSSHVFGDDIATTPEDCVEIVKRRKREQKERREREVVADRTGRSGEDGEGVCAGHRGGRGGAGEELC